MVREFVASMRLKGRKDASLTKSVKDARTDMAALGSDAQKAASQVQSSADRQSSALGRAERGTGRLSAGMARASQGAQKFGQAMRQATSALASHGVATKLANSTLDAAANKYTSLIGTVGGALAVRQVGNIQERFVRLGIQAGKSAEDMSKLKEEIYAASQMQDIRVNAGDLTSGIEAIVEKTGDLAFAQANLRNMGLAMQATGATGAAIGELFAEFQKQGITAPDNVMKALDTLTVQGKTGAFTLEHLANLGPRVVTAYNAMGRSGVEAMREMGAALQVMRQGTGSSESAATAFEAVMRTLSDPTKIKQLEALGVDVFDPDKLAEGKEMLRPINELLEEIVVKANGSMTVLGSIFDSEAQRGLNALIGEYSRDGEITSIKTFMEVQGDGTQTMQDAAKAALTLNAALTSMATAWEQFADKRLTKPIELAAKALHALGTDGMDTLFTVLGTGGGAVLAGLAWRKAYRGVKWARGLFGGKKGGKGERLADAISGASGDVMPVRVVNWPGGGLGASGGSATSRLRKGGAPAGAAPSALSKGKGLLKGGGKLLGRIAAPLTVAMGALDLFDAVANGSAKDVGSSLGGTGGALAGAAAGAALGSVVPVIGTAVGGIVGGMLGGFGGDALGGAVGGMFDSPADTGTDTAGTTGAAASPSAGAVTIHVHAAPGMDVEALARKVADMIQRRKTGALHDD